MINPPETLDINSPDFLNYLAQIKEHLPDSVFTITRQFILEHESIDFHRGVATTLLHMIEVANSSASDQVKQAHYAALLVIEVEKINQLKKDL